MHAQSQKLSKILRNSLISDPSSKETIDPEKPQNIKSSLQYAAYIDKNFPYPSSSTITNRIYYPGDWEFNFKSVLDRIKQEEMNPDEIDSDNFLSISFINKAPSPVLFMPIEDEASFVWKELSSAGKESVEGGSIVRVSENLILFGGQNRLKHNDVVQFNLTNLEWKNITTFYDPRPRSGHSAVGYKSKMIIYGGINKYSQNLSNCFILDIKSRIWSYISEGPEKLSNSSLTAIYHTSLMDQFHFDIYNIPTTYNHRIQKRGIYLYGGLKTDGTVFGDVWVLNVNEDPLWTKLETVGTPPTPRFNHTAEYIPGYLVIFGGRNDNHYAKTNELIGDIGVLALDNLTWQKIEILGDPPSNRWGHCSCTYDKKMIVFGGMDYKHYMPSSIFYLEAESTNTKIFS